MTQPHRTAGPPRPTPTGPRFALDTERYDHGHFNISDRVQATLDFVGWEIAYHHPSEHPTAEPLFLVLNPPETRALSLSRLTAAGFTCVRLCRNPHDMEMAGK